MKNYQILFFALFAVLANSAIAQKDVNFNKGRVIITAFPFLQINNDQQTTGLADNGTGYLQYNNSGNDNTAKILFNKNDFYGTVNYSNYLGSLVNDMGLTSMFLAYRLSKNDVVGLAVNNFSGGQIINTNQNAVVLGKYNSSEYNIKASYAKRLTDRLGIGVGFKYINSNIFNENQINGFAFKRAHKIGLDLGIYKRGILREFDDKSQYRHFGKKGRKYLDYGISITDIGSKISYNGKDNYNFMPTNLRIGASYNVYTQDKQKLTFMFEINKLLVPTPPEIDSEGKIIKGKSISDKNWFKGIMTSFTDAPEGISEEFKEVVLKLGTEYSINDTVYLRFGYSNESKMKGNRKNVAFGVGLNTEKFGANISYSIPLGLNFNPVGNTFRFGVSLSLSKKDKLDMNN